MGCPEDTELSVSIVGDRSIRRINRDYLERDCATNVISFSLREGEWGEISNALGDVVISADIAAREAEAGGINVLERLIFLLLHGILHLCGYDHERSGEVKAREMEQKERDLFRMLKKEGLTGS
ncbi:MAG: rRNA maturation RNase YbeY [Deltaproteobacteria bacterium]